MSVFSIYLRSVCRACSRAEALGYMGEPGNLPPPARKGRLALYNGLMRTIPRTLMLAAAAAPFLVAFSQQGTQKEPNCEDVFSNITVFKGCRRAI